MNLKRIKQINLKGGEKEIMKIKHKNKVNYSSPKGITLIALVVTIVVLLILAGVSMSVLFGDSGLIEKAKKAQDKWNNASANEQKDLSDLTDMIDKAIGKVEKVKVNTKANDNGTINGEKGNLNNPTIPKGYTPINEGGAEWGDGSTAPSQDSVNNGLVIKDDNNNEWVWIPVDSATIANMTEISSDAKTLCGTAEDTAITTNKYSKTMTIGTDRKYSRTAPGEIRYNREPDLVIGSDSASYDTKEEYYKTILGEEGTIEQLAQLFVNEYNEMIASIEKYGGFYIGRYELSSAGVQKDKKTLTSRNWYNLYNECRSSKLQASDRVKTQMIWGIQWDVTMNWLISSGAKTSIEVNKDSSSWGNYYNTLVKADDGITELKQSGERQVLNTGKTTFTMANNIYDLAGNCSEWTQEAYSNNKRICRGGYFYWGGSNFPASERVGIDFGPDISNRGDTRF